MLMCYRQCSFQTSTSSTGATQSARSTTPTTKGITRLVRRNATLEILSAASPIIAMELTSGRASSGLAGPNGSVLRGDIWCDVLIARDISASTSDAIDRSKYRRLTCKTALESGTISPENPLSARHVKNQISSDRLMRCQI